LPLVILPFSQYNSLNSWPWQGFPSSNVFFNFFLQIFIVLIIEVFYLFLTRLVLKYSILLRLLWMRFFYSFACSLLEYREVTDLIYVDFVFYFFD
jgi:hypothetical protein